MTAAVADEALDIDRLVAELHSWGESAKCTSRAAHRCSVAATHVSRSTKPCPDPIERVLWCQLRFEMHLEIKDKVKCEFCDRPCGKCWKVFPV